MNIYWTLAITIASVYQYTVLRLQIIHSKQVVIMLHKSTSNY